MTVRPFRLGGRFGVTLNLVSATGLPLDLIKADSPEAVARFTLIVCLTLALLMKYSCVALLTIAFRILGTAVLIAFDVARFVSPERASILTRPSCRPYISMVTLTNYSP